MQRPPKPNWWHDVTPFSAKKYFAFTLVVGVLWGTEVWITVERHALWFDQVQGVLVLLLWALIGMLIWAMLKRVPFTWKLDRSLVIYVAVGIGTLALQWLRLLGSYVVLSVGDLGMRPGIDRGSWTVWSVTKSYYTTGTVSSLLVYMGLLVALQFILTARQLGEEQENARQLSQQLSEMRLEQLRAQLRPHFLFNALHTVSALIRRDPAAAEEMLERVSGLLRLALEKQEKAMTTMGEELQFAETYLEIQKERFGDSFDFRVTAQSAAVAAKIPALLLQPLVENAVVHGRYEPGGAGLQLDVRCEDGLLVVVEIRNPGRLDRSHRKGTGVGLSNTRERLKLLYGPAHELEMRQESETVVLARLLLPVDKP